MRCDYPSTMREALGLLASAPDSILVAGCTDFYPAQGLRPVTRPVIDLSGIAEARAIRVEADHVRIGALTTWTDIATAALPPEFRSLQLAARQVGAIQIQNAGTIGGNICNASPAADGVPPLLCLEARVELSSADATRVLPLGDFILGNRKTARHPDEIVTAIVMPRRRGACTSTFLKLGSRSSLVISIAMVAVLLEADAAGTVARAAVAVGACSAVARRLGALEAALVGQPLSPALADLAVPAHLAPLSPIKDLRGTPEYRLDVALTMVRRGLAELGGLI